VNSGDIIRMAREAGFVIQGDMYGEHDEMARVECFANLVAAAERESCAKVVEQAGIDGYGTIAAALLVRERGAP
jgi:hypothetical protein